MSAAERTFGRPSVWRTVVIIAIVAAAIYFLTLIPKTVEVFIIATLIAYGINPILHRLRRRMPRAAAIALVYAVLIVLVIIASVIIIPDTVNQLQTFFQNSGGFVSGAQRWAGYVEHYITAHFGAQVLPPQLKDIEGRFAAEIGALLNIALAEAGNVVVGIANVLIIGITAVVLSYYLLTHSDEIRTSFFSLFPERSQKKAHQFAYEVSRAVGGFIFGQIVLSAFSGAATFVLLLLFRSDYALLLGVLTGLLYAIPYIGIFIAVVLGALLGALQSWPMALITAAIIFIVTRISDYVLVPKVMAESVGVSPMAIIFAVFAGGELFGIWGLILGIPAAAIFKVAWRVWLHPWLTGRTLEAA